MTSKEIVLAKLTEILETSFRIPKSKIAPAATFRGTFGMDSLDTVDFIYLVKKTFQLQGELEEFRQLHALENIVDYVARKIEEGQASVPAAA